jgi:hypothetical protein
MKRKNPILKKMLFNYNNINIFNISINIACFSKSNKISN